MKCSRLLIPGLLLAFNAHASKPGEEFKDTSKKSWSQMPIIHSSQISTSTNQETLDEDDFDSPSHQLIAKLAEQNALLQIQEQKNKKLKKELEEKKQQAEQQKMVEALEQRMAIEKQHEQQLLDELAAQKASKNSNNNNDQNVKPANKTPGVTSIEQDKNNVTANPVNNQPVPNVNNEPEFRFTGEGIARLLNPEGYRPDKSNWVNLTSFFRND